MPFLIFLFAFVSLQTLTAQPAPFEDLMHARYEPAYYVEHAEKWRSLAEDKEETDEAWLQYYRYANQANRFGLADYDLAALKEVAREKLSKDGFTWNFLDYLTDTDPLLRWAKLLRAYAANPDRPDLYPAMITYYEMLGDPDSRDRFLQKLLLEDPLPAGVLDYNYNQLHSVPQGAILVTHGAADTYPSWLLQVAYGVRPDVRVVSLPLLVTYDDYANRLFASVGAHTIGVRESNYPVYRSFKVPDQSEQQRLRAQISNRISRLASRPTPVYVAATGKDVLEVLPAHRLYLTGLAFRHTKTPFNNLQSTLTAYSGYWRLESLRQPLADGPGQRVADQLNRNYLPALFQLYDYRDSRIGVSGPELLAIINSVAERAGITEEVADYLRDEPAPPKLASATPGLTAKEIGKNYAYLIEPWKETKYRKHLRHPKFTSLSFGETEVSNADYRLFLADLKRQGLSNYLDLAAVTQVDFIALLGDSLGNYTREDLLSRGYPTADDHPVTNITPQGARLYAAWLTQVYNQDPKRKSPRKVRFRLPTKDEFAYAARGGYENAPYPWGGPYVRNRKGCTLTNFNTFHPDSRLDFAEFRSRMDTWTAKQRAEHTKIQECDIEDDGGFLTVPVTSYYPNNYALYNMSGNAAEMIDEDGKTMGGSWLDPISALWIGVVTERTLPHPSTGFRLVMERLVE